MPLEREEVLHRCRQIVFAVFQGTNAKRSMHAQDVAEINNAVDRLEAAGYEVSDFRVPDSTLRGGGMHYSASGRREEIPRAVPWSEAPKYILPLLDFLERQVIALNSSSSDVTSTEASSELMKLTPGKVGTEPASNEAWVIYGHDESFRKEIFDLLRNIGLRPIEFETAITRSGSGSPHVLQVILDEIARAPVVIALWTADEEARLIDRTPLGSEDSERLNRVGC